MIFSFDTELLNNRLQHGILHSENAIRFRLHLFFSTVASYDPCGNYKSLNAADRLETFTGQSPVRCDQRDIIPGWYRFTAVAGNPQMPTSCPPVRRCGTHAPGWIKGHPSVADGEVTRQVCYHWANNCCQWKNNIKVKNCGAFYVYNLQKTPACSLRYCGEWWPSPRWRKTIGQKDIIKRKIPSVVTSN